MKAFTHMATKFKEMDVPPDDAYDRTVAEPARQTPLRGEFDVAVLGGGPAGMAAAIAAAQAGARTLLIESYGFLGGMGTAAGVTNFCGLHANVHGEIRQVVHGIADDILARIKALGGLNEPHLLFGGKAAGLYVGAKLAQIGARLDTGPCGGEQRAKGEQTTDRAIKAKARQAEHQIRPSRSARASQPFRNFFCEGSRSVIAR